MKAKDKTKEELIKELKQMRTRIAELEKSETKRKRAEDKLCQYEHIVSSSTDMLALLDKNFVYLAANKSYRDAFKLTSDELIGRSISEVFGKELFNTIIKPNAERCMDGEEVNYQAWFDFPAYEQRYMDINYYPYVGRDNEVKGFVVNWRNITENKQVEEELKKIKDGLEITVAERTKELQERVSELERFHKATIDRELRMKELRDKIEELEKKLEEKQK